VYTAADVLKRVGFSEAPVELVVRRNVPADMDWDGRTRCVVCMFFFVFS
jgi:hypothetical protein